MAIVLQRQRMTAVSGDVFVLAAAEFYTDTVPSGEDSEVDIL